MTPHGWTSKLARVDVDVYIGRTAAGGFASQIDLDGDSKSDVVLNVPCGFMLQLKSGKITAIEADRAVDADIRGRKMHLDAFIPRAISPAR
jgi:hypothetical protein